jgi:hypothetical protein
MEDQATIGNEDEHIKFQTKSKVQISNSNFEIEVKGEVKVVALRAG